MIYISIRLDDPSASSNHALEKEIIDVLETNSIPATLAAIPFRVIENGRLELSRINAAHIVDAARRGSIEVAMHGHSHIHRAIGSEPSEFKGLPIDWQYQLLAEAAGRMRNLFGVNAVPGFVPPWNSLDSNTLKALAELGFHYASVGRAVPFWSTALKIVPMTCNFCDLEIAVTEAMGSSQSSAWIIAVLHAYDFKEHGAADAWLDLDLFLKLLGTLRQRSDIEFCSIGTLIQSITWRALARGIRTRSLSTVLPWRFRGNMAKYSISDVSLLRRFVASIKIGAQLRARVENTHESDV